MATIEGFAPTRPGRAPSHRASHVQPPRVVVARVGHRRRPPPVPGARAPAPGRARRLLRRAGRHAGAPAVVDAMRDYLLHHNANTHWRYPDQRRDRRGHRRGARRARRLPRRARPTEIAFGANMTTLTFHLARALARGWAPGDEIVVTELDHHANVDPWRALAARARRDGPDGAHRSGDRRARLGRPRRQIIGPRTKLVAIGAASNALGTINDVAGPPRLAHAAGALAFVDAVHYAPHALVDVAGARLRLPGLLGLQVLRAARRRALRAPRAPRGARRAEAAAGARRRAGAARDRHAEPRGHRRRGGGRRVPRVDPRPRRRRPGTARRARARLRGVLHAQGEALLARLWEGLAAIPGVRLLRPPPGSRARRPSPSRSPAAMPATSPSAWPTAASSSRTATSTPPRSSSGWRPVPGRPRPRGLRLLHHRGGSRSAGRGHPGTRAVAVRIRWKCRVGPRVGEAPARRADPNTIAHP